MTTGPSGVSRLALPREALATTKSSVSGSRRMECSWSLSCGFSARTPTTFGPEGDSYYTTSADGLSWSDPLTIQDPDPDGAFVDTIPTVIETPRGTFIVWVSDRLGSGLEVLSVPLGGDAVTVVADAGFSTRTHDLGDGRVLFAFVQPHVVDGVSRNDVFFRVYDCSSPACGAK